MLQHLTRAGYRKLESVGRGHESAATQEMADFRSANKEWQPTGDRLNVDLRTCNVVLPSETVPDTLIFSDTLVFSKSPDPLDGSQRRFTPVQMLALRLIGTGHLNLLR